MGIETIIEPVPARRRDEAIKFIAGGRWRDAISALRAEVLSHAVKSHGNSARLWWARRGRKCVAAVMVPENPGRTAMLFQSPSDARGVDGPALIELIRAACRASLEKGTAFVQAMVDPGNRPDTDILREAGFEKLAELLFMRQDLSSRVPSGHAADEPDLVWRSYGQFDDAELGRVIESTYTDSCDCPQLAGRRAMSDVIVGHKAGGVFRPEAWWIVSAGAAAAGCILVNDFLGSGSADVAYLGVVPASRGRGLARTMLRRAAEKARNRRLGSLTLAVDADNVFARKIYDSEGFEETARRLAYVFFRGA